jgi:glycerophosphoryl diester phosphodiesterase
VGLGTALLAGASALPALGGLLAGVFGGAAAGYGLTLHQLRNRDLQREVDVIIPGKRFINSKMIDKAHQLGKEIAVYTIDDPARGRKLVNWGVDALISNYPERHLT